MKDKLLKRWISAGLKKDDNILLHSSFKSTLTELSNENYKVSIQDLLDSFLDLISPNGTIVFPTFNFDFTNKIKYDYYKTTSQMGAITELARNHKLAQRTLNPVYSFAAFGKKSNLFDSIDNINWYAKDSPLSIIHKLNFKICIIDLRDRNSMTFAHYCEEFFQVPWRYYKRFSGNYVDKEKNTSIKTCVGYVRKINEGIETTLDPAGELMWEKKIYKGSKPFEKTGIRYVMANDYFNLFKELYMTNNCNPYYYNIKK